MLFCCACLWKRCLRPAETLLEDSSLSAKNGKPWECMWIPIPMRFLGCLLIAGETLLFWCKKTGWKWRREDWKGIHMEKEYNRRRKRKERKNGSKNGIGLKRDTINQTEKMGSNFCIGSCINIGAIALCCPCWPVWHRWGSRFWRYCCQNLCWTRSRGEWNSGSLQSARCLRVSGWALRLSWTWSATTR